MTTPTQIVTALRTAADTMESVPGLVNFSYPIVDESNQMCPFAWFYHFLYGRSVRGMTCASIFADQKDELLPLLSFFPTTIEYETDLIREAIDEMPDFVQVPAVDGPNLFRKIADHIEANV